MTPKIMETVVETGVAEICGQKNCGEVTPEKSWLDKARFC